MIKEWLEEPDTKEFESNGYKCVIKRHPSLKHLCGYVHIPKTHNLYGVGYNELYGNGIDIDVHGGITYAEEEDGEWVYGFDCAHWHDLVPSSIENGYYEPGDVYRNMAYVESEINLLTNQLKAFEKATE